MKKNILLFLVFCFIFAGCAEKKVVKPESGISQETPPYTAKEPSKKPAELKPEERITEERFAKIETKDEMSRYIEERGLFADIYFDYDMYDVRADAKPVLEKISAWLLKNPAAKILIEGHCDDRGTNEYNLALGDRRAKAVRDYLIALGVALNRIEMLSYGEEKPLCRESTEECWAKNRRAHFVVLKEAVK